MFMLKIWQTFSQKTFQNFFAR